MGEVYINHRLSIPAGVGVTVTATVVNDGTAPEVAHDAALTPVTPLFPGKATGIVIQVAAPRIVVDGTEIPFDRFVGEWSYERDIERPVQTFTFSMWTKPGDRYFADARSPATIFAPATCKAAVDVYGRYMLADGSVISYPLILGGVVDVQERAQEGDVTIETFAVLDAGALAQRALVTATYPTGGTLTRDELAREVLALAGVTETDFEAMGTTGKQLVLADADPLNAIADLFSIESRGIVWSPSGVPQNPRLRPTRSPIVTLNEGDVYEVSPLSYTTDAITRAIVTGYREEVDPNSVGASTERLHFESWQPSNQDPQRYKQGGSGTLVASSFWPGVSATLRKVEQVDIENNYRCGVLVSRFTDRWGFYNKVRNRYSWTGSAWGNYTPCYLADGAVQDGNVVEGRLGGVQRWQRLGYEEERYFYDVTSFGSAPVFLRGSLTNWPIIPSREIFSDFSPSFDTGHYLGRYRLVWGLVAAETALKSRSSASTTWESQSYISGVRIRGPLVGMDSATGGIETMQLIEGEYERVYADDDGVLKQRTILRLGLARYPGWKYLYSDGSEGANPDDVYGPKTMIVESYTSSTAAKHTVRTSYYDFEATRERITIEDRPGPAPLVDRVRKIEDDEVVIANPGGLSGCIPSAIETPLESEVEAPELEECHVIRRERLDFPGAESVDELEAAGEVAIRESFEPQVSIEMPLNWSIREGRSVLLDFAPLDLSGAEVMIRSVRSAGTWTGPAVPTTTIVGKIRSPEA